MKLDNLALKKAIEHRLQQNVTQELKIKFSIESNSKITIVSKKPLSIKKITFNEVLLDKHSINCNGSDASYSGLFRSKWNKENHYELSLPSDYADTLIEITFDTGDNNANSPFETSYIVSQMGISHTHNFESLAIGIDKNILSEHEELLYNCLVRKSPIETFAALAETKNDDLTNLCAKILSPSILTPHGYSLPIKHKGEECLLASMSEFIYDFNSLGYELMINSGTLLGSVRDGKFIPHDDDIDFFVVLKSTDLQSLADEILDLEEKLRELKLIRGPGIGETNQLFHWKLKYVSSTNIDVFPSWIIDGKVYVWPYSFGEISTLELYPVKKCKINNVFLTYLETQINFF